MNDLKYAIRFPLWAIAGKPIEGGGADVFDYRGVAIWASGTVQEAVLDLGTATGSPGTTVAVIGATPHPAVTAAELVVMGCLPFDVAIPRGSDFP